MSKSSISGVVGASGSNSVLLQTHVDPDLHRRNCGGQIAHAHQIVGSAGEGKDPVHRADSAMPNLAHEGNRLQPAKAFGTGAVSRSQPITV